MFKRFLLQILILVAAVVMTAGCESIDKLLNSESDRKMSHDDTLKPTPYGMISDTKQFPAAPSVKSSNAIDDIEREVVTGIKKENRIKLRDDELLPSKETLEKVDANDSLLFERVFPGRDPEERIKLDLNGDNININTIIAQFAGYMNFSYTIESGVQGAVSMSLHAELSLTETWNLFLRLLWMCNAYGEYRDGILSIRPLNAVGRSQQILAGDGNVMLKSVRMKYVTSTSVLPQIKPFLSGEATAYDLPQSNSLLLIDTPNNVNRLLEIIAELDRSYKQGWYRVVFQCNDVSASKVKEELKQVMPVLGFQIFEGEQVDSKPGAIHLVSLDRLQVLVASASAVEPLTELRKWVDVLNSNENNEQTNAYIYKVVNSDAAQLLTELSVLFPNMVGVVIPAKSESTRQVNGVSITEAGKAMQTSETLFDFPVRIAANLEYNRLVIMASPRVYSILRAVLEKLDTIPPQVLLQIMVVEIELTDETDFGMEWNAQTTIGGEKMGFGTDYLNLESGGKEQFGGKINIVDPDNPDSKFLYIKALAGKSKLKVISSPQVLVRSQWKAQINVGREVPLLVADIANIDSTNSDSTTMRRSYEYKDTGIILEVTPTVSESGLVSLDIRQEISESLANITSGFDTPIIKKDIIQSNLAIHNGRTIVVGGLIRERDEESLSSIPWIADVPMLNWLVGDSTRSAERTEILMLITATVVDHSTRLEEMVRRYSDSLREINVFENNIYAPYNRRREEAIERGMIPREVMSSPESSRRPEDDLRMFIDSGFIPKDESAAGEVVSVPAASDSNATASEDVPEAAVEQSNEQNDGNSAEAVDAGE